ADVEEHGDADAGFFSPEFRDRPRHPAVFDLEIGGGQTGDETSLLVAHHGIDSHQVDAGLERSDRLIGRRPLQRRSANAEAANREDAYHQKPHRPASVSTSPVPST